MIAQTDLLELANKYPENPEEMFAIMAAQELVHRRETLIGRVRGKGALALEISPDALTTVLVNRYLEVKERGLI